MVCLFVSYVGCHTWNYKQYLYNAILKLRKGVAIMTDMIKKCDIIKRLDMEKDKWKAIKGHDRDQDVTHENFIDNVILIYEWVIRDVERM